jgi:CheY-like chemotaxis protein
MSKLAGKRILIVEDEPIVAMCLEDMLQSLGCLIVGPAARLSEGLALAADEQVDAAILDVNLGKDRSYPIADLLRARSIPFVFATGYGRTDYAMDPDAGLLEKPYSADQVRSVLAALMPG